MLPVTWCPPAQLAMPPRLLAAGSCCASEKVMWMVEMEREGCAGELGADLLPPALDLDRLQQL